MSGKLAVRAGEGLAKAQQTPARQTPAQQTSAPGDAAEEPVVVLGSGNLGLVYVRGARRWTLEELDREWPALVPGLAGHPGVGFVAGIDDEGRAWAIGSGGRLNIASGEVEGTSPLASYGPHAARMLLRALLLREAPDLYVNSTVDPVTGDVTAFEGLVGSHGDSAGGRTAHCCWGRPILWRGCRSG
ncbi:hypothetical protein PJ267_05940 [Arthrobacter sp. OVS8]|nr:hypothetical protein PJ267_05940 [Arthrobacter sp. OVS8]